MSHTFYCEKCDDFSHTETGNCQTCGTLKEKLMTHDQCKHFRWACEWIVKHANSREADQPLEVVQLIYLSYINFVDQFRQNKRNSFQRADEYTGMASEKFVNSVTPEDADQNLKDVIGWKLSEANATSLSGEYVYEIEKQTQPVFPKTDVEIRACLHLIYLDSKFDLVKSYLRSLL